MEIIYLLNKTINEEERGEKKIVFGRHLSFLFWKKLHIFNVTN